MKLTEVHEPLQQHVIAIQEMVAEIQDIVDNIQIRLNEDSIGSDVHKQLADAIAKLNAAKRGLGLVNKLRPGQDKAKHAIRVMSNLNKLRAAVQQLNKQVKSKK